MPFDFDENLKSDLRFIFLDENSCVYTFLRAFQLRVGILLEKSDLVSKRKG